MEKRSRTARLDIGARAVYPTVAFDDDGKLVYLQIKIGHQGSKNESMTGEEIDRLRALMEIVCVEAMELLQRGWSLTDLIECWRATRCPPDGPCKQIDGVALSPLDAVARWLEKIAIEEMINETV